MNKYYVITMSDGSEWGVPAEIIAKDKADYREGKKPGCYQEEFDAMMRWFDEDDFEFADWARNYMSWDDISDYAVCLKDAPVVVEFRDGWINGEYKYATYEKRGI